MLPVMKKATIGKKILIALLIIIVVVASLTFAVYSFIFWIVVIMAVLFVAYNIYIRTGGRGNEEQFGGNTGAGEQPGGGVIENDLQ